MNRKQTHKSIRKNFIEETYETLETIDNDDPVAMEAEVGTFTVMGTYETLEKELQVRIHRYWMVCRYIYTNC